MFAVVNSAAAMQQIAYLYAYKDFLGKRRQDKARTAARAIRAEEYVLPNHSCLARQHTIKIRLLSLDVKPASADKKQGLDVQGPASGVVSLIGEAFTCLVC